MHYPKFRHKKILAFLSLSLLMHLMFITILYGRKKTEIVNVAAAPRVNRNHLSVISLVASEQTKVRPQLKSISKREPLSLPKARFLKEEFRPLDSKRTAQQFPSEKSLPVGDPPPAEFTEKDSSLNKASSLSSADIGALSEVSNKEIRSYQAELRYEIDSHKIYPEIAKVRRQQGWVEVRFTVKSDGQLIDIQLHKPSLFSALNLAALTSVRHVGKFKAFPSEIAKQSLDLIVPIHFELN